MDSTRLPNKAMLELAGKPLLSHVIERSKSIMGSDNVVLATGRIEKNTPIVNLAKSLGIQTYCGSDENVLDRYIGAAERYGGDYIIRVTGDNPFTDPEYASQTLRIALLKNADLCSPSNLPLGVAVEIIKYDALHKAYQKSSRPYHFEHVTPYIKENQDIFKIVKHEIDYRNPFPDLRLTVDEWNDYLLGKTIYEQLYKGIIFSLDDVIQFIEKNQYILEINKSIRQRHMTEASIDEQ